MRKQADNSQTKRFALGKGSDVKSGVFCGVVLAGSSSKGV